MREMNVAINVARVKTVKCTRVLNLTSISESYSLNFHMSMAGGMCPYA